MLEMLPGSAIELISRGDMYILLDGIPVPLAIGSFPGGEIRYVNKAFTRLFGYENGRFDTVTQWLDEVYDADQRQLIAQRRAALLEPGDVPHMEVGPHEYQVRCSDGTYRTVINRETILWDVGIGMATFEDISDLKRAEEGMRQDAHHDALTGLPNRRALQERWDRWSGETGQRVAVVVADLDGFKPVNDRLGHHAGDQVLCAIGKRLSDTVRVTDFVSRIGGDEFVLLIELGEADVPDDLLDRLLAVLREPHMIDGCQILVGASFGVSLYPSDGRTLGDLTQSADKALYRCKQGGGSGWERAIQ